MPLNDKHQRLIEHMMEPLLQEQLGKAKTRRELTAGINYFLQVMNDPDNHTTAFAKQFQEPREIAGITAFGSFSKGEAREFMIESADGIINDLIGFMPSKVQADPRLLGWQKDLLLADVRGRHDHGFIEEPLRNGHKAVIESNIDYLFDHLTPESIEASQSTDKKVTADSLRQDVSQINAAMQAHARNEYEPFSRIFDKPEEMLRIDQYGQLTRGAARHYMIEFADRVVTDAATALAVSPSECGWDKSAAITHMERRLDHHASIETVPQQELVADWTDHLRSLRPITHPADAALPAEPVMMLPNDLPPRVGPDRALMHSATQFNLLNHAHSQRENARARVQDLAFSEPVSAAASPDGANMVARSSPPTPVRMSPIHQVSPRGEEDEAMDGWLESRGASPRQGGPVQRNNAAGEQNQWQIGLQFVQSLAQAGEVDSHIARLNQQRSRSERGDRSDGAGR